MGKLRLLVIFLFAVLGILGIAGVRNWWQKETLLSDFEKDFHLMKNSPVEGLSIEQTINLGDGKELAVVYNIVRSVSGLAITDYKDNFLAWLPEGEPLLRDGHFREPGEYLERFRFDDSFEQGYGKRVLLVQFANSGTAGVHPFYVYSFDMKKKTFTLLLKLVEASNKVEIKDLDSDGNPEIVDSYSLSGTGGVERNSLRWKDIWHIENGNFTRVNEKFPQEYQDLFSAYAFALGNPDANYYSPVINCLKEKAILITRGKRAEVTPCQKILEDMYASAQKRAETVL